MTYKNIFIDINNLFFRAYHYAVLKKLIVDGVELYPTLIQKCLKTINYLRETYGSINANVYCLFDNCQSAINIRKIISCNEYKSNRDKNKVPKGFYKTLDILFYLLEHYKDNHYILRLASNEADDLVDPLIKYIKPKDTTNNCLLVSSDLDWARSIAKHVHWYNYQETYDIHKFEKRFAFSPTREKVILYKIFMGDSSDHIKPAIPYLRDKGKDKEKVILDIVNNFESLDNLLENLFSTDLLTEELKIKINNNMEKIKINEQLVSFLPIKKKIDDIIINCYENIPHLKMTYEILELPFEPRMINSAQDFFRKNNPLKKNQKLRIY